MSQPGVGAGAVGGAAAGSDAAAKKSGSLAIVGLQIVVLAALYVVGAKLGLELAFENRNVTAVWPPTGIAVATLLLSGLRVWPGIAIGAIVANLLNDASPQTAVGIAVGNTIAPVLAAFVLRRLFRFRNTLDHVSDAMALVFVGGFGAMAVSATLGTLTLMLTGAIGDDPVASVWAVWWVGDSIGVVVVAPFLILVDRGLAPGPVRDRPIETAALILGAAAMTYAAFSTGLTVAHLVFIPIVWAALRLGQLGAATVTLLVAVIAVIFTAGGEGPFSSLSPTENLVSLQVFNASVALTALVLAAIMSERRRAEDALRASEHRYRRVFEEANDFVCIHDLHGMLTYVNGSAERITGYTRDRLVSMNIDELVAPEDIRVIRRMTERQLSREEETATYEVDIVGTSGRRVTLEASATLVYESGEPTGVQLIGRDITWRRLAEDELRNQALHDVLTGLPNRTLLVERLGYSVDLARRDGGQVVFVVLRIDEFKDLVEKHGHQSIEALIRQLGSRLGDAFKAPDTLARVSSDEFALIIPRLPRDKAPRVIGEQIRGEIEAPFDVGTVRIGASASVGIAIYPDHADDADELIQCADIAAFAARSSGQEYVIYRPDLDDQAVRRQSLESDLHFALDEQGLVLHYQPKIDVSSLRTLGVEALVRWQHPRRGLIPPLTFIPMAENAGMIEQITAWVLEESVRQCAIWLEAGLDLGVSVNLSPVVLRDGLVIDRLRRTLDKHGVPAERLTLEVTESAMTDEGLLGILGRIGALGIGLSVDDFGTGSTSLVNLRRLPISEMKIDRSFVSGLISNSEDRKIAESIVELGHSMDVQVVAEGIETRATWSKVTDLDCDQAQGFLICKPVPATELESWLRTPAWTGRVR